MAKEKLLMVLDGNMPFEIEVEKPLQKSQADREVRIIIADLEEYNNG